MVMFEKSMSSQGSYYDIEVTESFFHALEIELVYHEKYEPNDQARNSIFKYIKISIIGVVFIHQLEVFLAINLSR